MIIAKPTSSAGAKVAPSQTTEVTVAMTGSEVASMEPRTEPTSLTPCR